MCGVEIQKDGKKRGAMGEYLGVVGKKYPRSDNLPPTKGKLDIDAVKRRCPQRQNEKSRDATFKWSALLSKLI